ncbi:putative Glutamate decarboxylase [Taphrina deformans PYCC 5710]|uniref:Glutamate decarboxylase n=1 Tax=Taphrina deformans (strain PYCC 5710 / ATCC 11124 / CBS 356.35 / IMI 108563 / JCM 9778 / NBRC 8474) TaxID=1097556 RepID=R4XG13_TAPDE|nr:putative Glutamate decarboxylase [Taphrina deformans PYCC 5710]|eukprot:CCG83439.1 putative Glutamate decarboxylase [Taphrina deformans PYCC 5710]
MNTASTNAQATATELQDLLTSFQGQFLPWIAKADHDDSKVLDHYSAQDLKPKLALSCPEKPCGKDALLEILSNTLRYSANTWNPGFMDKLFASTNPIGVISELLLAVLNTNGHVFHVSPVLTLMELETSKAMAQLFGYSGEHCGGLTLPGGSQSNTLSIVTARTTLYPETKENGCGKYQFVMFTSKHGHYSVEKAAIMLGLGRNSVVPIDIDGSGRIKPDSLEKAVLEAKADGKTPFYVNATAGTTVFGSFDPFTEISAICKRHNLWMHIDGSWGGGVAFSNKYKHLLTGSHLADSITINPHKMLGVPLQCSFLLAPDSRIFQQANSLKAGYLFHGDNEGFDLGDSTMGCGRRPDAVKMFLGWNWYGREGYEQRVNHAYEMAGLLATKIAKSPKFTLVSSNPPPCLQVCFYYHSDSQASREDSKVNTKTTRRIASALDHQGRFLVDYAPGPHGEFFRAVLNSPNQNEATLDELVNSIEKLAGQANGH